jgi:hypothetical protein
MRSPPMCRRHAYSDAPNLSNQFTDVVQDAGSGQRCAAKQLSVSPRSRVRTSHYTTRGLADGLAKSSRVGIDGGEREPSSCDPGAYTNGAQSLRPGVALYAL